MRTSLAFIALLGTTTLSFAQGEVFFANTASSITHIWTISGNYPGLERINQPGGSWTFALFSAPSTVTDVDFHDWWGPLPWLDSNWQFTGVYGTNTGALGRMAGWTPGNQNYAAVIPGHPAGETVSLVAIGWNTAVGGSTLADFIAVRAAYDRPNLIYGGSAVARIELGNGALIPNVFMFGAGPGQIPGFILGVPEPSALALTALGVAALLLRRQRSRGRLPVK